jgi:hypothetical protein
MDRGYTPKQFVGLLATETAKQVSKIFESKYGQLRMVPRAGHAGQYA